MALLFALTALTAYRVTRLLTRDQFPPIEVQRARAAARWGDESWQAYLVRCPWCAGVYVAGLTVAAVYWAVGGLPVPLLWWGATAALVGLLASVDAALDRD